LSLKERALDMHRKSRGKIEIISKVPVKTREDLSLAYTPGVADASRETARDKSLMYEYTSKWNLVAVVSDGTAVLGLGNIGPEGAMPVMEGKSILFKNFAGVDAFPLCVSTSKVEDIVNLVKWIEPTIGGVNLEDISAPRCFDIENRLKEETDIPIFHDDQHGTAVVVLAAMKNALKLVSKKPADTCVVINGAGAAGIATALLFITAGYGDIILCDTKGAIYEGRTEGMNMYKQQIALATNRRKIKGDLAQALVGADAFVGLSAPGCVTKDMVSRMAKHSILLPMANPVPEIFPDEAIKGGAAVVGTGRSDFANQVNNVLAFPGILRGALDTRSTDINEAMKLAAADAIADLIPAAELKPEYIIVDPFDRRVAPAVAKAVAQSAMESGVARVQVDPDQVAENTRQMVEIVNSGV